MKSKWLLIPLAAATLAGGFFATKTFASNDVPVTSSPATPRLDRILQHIADRLDLTTDQQTRIKAVITGDLDYLKPLITSLHDARAALRTTIQANGSTEADVRAASAKVATVEADLAVERLKLFGKIGPILTGDQRAKLSELEQNFDSMADNFIARLGTTEP